MGKLWSGFVTILKLIAIIIIVLFAVEHHEEISGFVDSVDDSDSIRVGSFNIQVFGTAKASEPEVMDVLSRIIRTYDVVAIQEIRDSSQTALPALVDLVNSDGSRYEYVVSDRLGRTVSREQYAYIFNSKTVKLESVPYTYPEPAGADPFHREPYIATFGTVNGDFDATLITVHTDPDEAESEINALDEVVDYAAGHTPFDQDIIVMGDFNADGSYFDEDGPSDLKSSEYTWIIGNDLDTTTKTTDCTYDRMVLTGSAVPYFTGESGVFRYDTIYGLTESETIAVSDHYPVYAEFKCGGIGGILPEIPVPENISILVPAKTSSEPVMVLITDLNLAGEWVNVTNTGTSSVDMTGWALTDADVNNRYTFPSYELPEGATVTVYTGSGDDTPVELYWGCKKGVWDNDGDCAELHDTSGRIIATRRA